MAKQYKEKCSQLFIMENFLTIKNKKVIDFYKKNKNLNFESMNVIFVEILENLLRNTNPTLDSNTAAAILDSINSLQTQVNNINDTVSKNQNEINNMFTLKFIEFKREYMEEIRLIIANNSTEKVAPIIKEYNESLLDKTRIMIGDIIPKNHDSLYKCIDSSLQQLHTNINNDTNNLMKSSLTKDVLENFSSNLDEKITKTILSSQNTLNSLLTSTEQRIDNRLSEIKDISSKNDSSQSTLCTNINDLLRKMENSSSKGKISENLLFNVIHTLYPIAQIESVGTTKETGDIMLKRKDKHPIMFENKNYDRNVGQEEVRKFIRDVEIQKCSGIMLAQHFGIANKNNFEIEVNNNNVLVYLHCVEYNADKIKTAVDIIDYFKDCIEELELDNGDNINMSKEFLNDINKEYQNFINYKLSHIKNIKDYNSKLLAQAEELKLPSLEHYLSKLFASSVSKDTTCDYCNYVAKNLRALTAHHRGCALKKQHDLKRREKLTQELANNKNVLQYNPNV